MKDVKKLAKELADLTNKETLELVAELELLGFKAQEPQKIVEVQAKEVEKEVEKTSFNVMLVDISKETGPKLNTVKLYKNTKTGITLMEAKAAVEGTLPIEIVANVSKEEANQLKAQFEETGAKISIV